VGESKRTEDKDKHVCI